jgi:hypothetical protein
VTLNLADMAVKTAHGISLTEWNNLTDAERRDMRDNVTHAEHFTTGTP